uniref:Vacuole morphology and inheritance protein 14 n=1 Tax=Tetraselmis sp. GSL018 TaxID=582737 RepID=A0A061SJN4_9CHLO
MLHHSNPLQLLSPQVLKNLGDKLYERRKVAALDIEQLVKRLVSNGETGEVHALIQKLVEDFARSPNSNQRKGALLGIAAVACGLTNQHINEYLPQVMPPVLESITDQDSRVRFYAVESLYNIADIAREGMLPFMNKAFDGLFRVSADADDHLRSAVPYAENLLKDIACNSPEFDIARFIPELAARMDSTKPYNRRFILGWIEALASSTMVDILVFLPDLLDGLLAMLSDQVTVLVLRQGHGSRRSSPSHRSDWQPLEIRHMTSDVLSQLLGYIREQGGSGVDCQTLVENVLVPRAEEKDTRICVAALTWVKAFTELAMLQVPLQECGENARIVRLQLLATFHLILHALLHCISSPSEAVRGLVERINQSLLMLKDQQSWSRISMERMLEVAAEGLDGAEEETRLLALRWINFLLHINQHEVLQQVNDLIPPLIEVMIGPSNRVVLESISVQAAFAASNDTNFRIYFMRLVECFQAPKGAELLQRRGSMVLRRLCMLLGAERCFVELAERLRDQTNLQYASTMVQALNLILLTAPETKELRQLLQRCHESAAARRLFLILYKSWCHSPGAVLMLCFLAQAYGHAAAVIHTFGDSDWDADVLVQLDRVVRLLESPVFTFLRLHLLRPREYPSLMHALYGLLMLLPQGAAFRTLSARLNAVPMVGMMQLSVDPPKPREGPLFGSERARQSEQPRRQGADVPDEEAERMDLEDLMRHFRELQSKHAAEGELRRISSSAPEGQTSQAQAQAGPGGAQAGWRQVSSGNGGRPPPKAPPIRQSSCPSEFSVSSAN